MVIVQGDSYNIGLTVLNNAGSTVTPDDVIDIAVQIGTLRKTYLAGELSFADGKWFFPITQEESFRNWPKAAKAQISIKWNSGVVERKPIRGIRFHEGIDKEEL